MPVVLIVVLLVSTGEAASPVTLAMARAARGALGPGVELRLEERADDLPPPTPAEGEAVVSVEWDSHRTGAVLRYRDSTHTLDRRVTFGAADAPAERGRTLGFLLASMLPEDVSMPPPQPERPAAPARTTTRAGPPPGGPAPARATPPARPARPEARRPAASPPPTRPPPRRTPAVAQRSPGSARRPSPRPAPASSRGAPPEPARRRTATDPEAAGVAGTDPGRPPEAPPYWRGAIEASGLLAIGAGDDDGTASFGGAVAGLWWPARALGLRVQLEARSGSVTRAQATTLWLSGAAGAAWSFLQLRGPLSLDAGLRADVGLARQSFSHFSDDDDVPLDEARWLGFADAALELRLRVTSGIAVTIAGGIEAPFTTTDLYVGGQRRATLGAPRALLGLGIAAGL